jgi:hypothetical protein
MGLDIASSWGLRELGYRRTEDVQLVSTSSRTFTLEVITPIYFLNLF